MSEMKRARKNKLANIFNELKISSDKDLLDLKLYKLMELKEKYSISIYDIEAIWKIQKALISDSKFKWYINN